MCTSCTRGIEFRYEKANKGWWYKVALMLLSTGNVLQLFVAFLSKMQHTCRSCFVVTLFYRYKDIFHYTVLSIIMKWYNVNNFCFMWWYNVVLPPLHLIARHVLLLGILNCSYDGIVDTFEMCCCAACVILPVLSLVCGSRGVVYALSQAGHLVCLTLLKCVIAQQV